MKGGQEVTNSKELMKLIEDRGLKLKFVAEKLGLSSYGLSLKINNKSEFKTSEVATLCELLEITSLREKERIFFAHKDDCKSTNAL